MPPPVVPAKPRGLALMFGWSRLRSTLGMSIAAGLLMSLGWKSGPISILERTLLLGLIAMVVFGVFEQWPKRLPRWLAHSMAAIKPHACQEEQEAACTSPALPIDAETSRVRHAHGCAGREGASRGRRLDLRA